MVQVKEAPRGSLRINTVCNFKAMKSVVELNRLLLKFLLLCHGVVIQKGYCGDKAKFNFLGIIWESKKVVEDSFFRSPKILKSIIFWVHYKSPVLSYTKVRTYN